MNTLIILFLIIALAIFYFYIYLDCKALKRERDFDRELMDLLETRLWKIENPPKYKVGARIKTEMAYLHMEQVTRIEGQVVDINLKSCGTWRYWEYSIYEKGVLTKHRL